MLLLVKWVCWPIFTFSPGFLLTRIKLLLLKKRRKKKNGDGLDEFDDYSDDEFETREHPTANLRPQTWFKKANILTEDDRNDYSQSYKLLFLIEIIKQCEIVGDKLLVFSQSLETLRLIKRMLEALSPTWFDEHDALLMKPRERWGWKFNHDFMIIDGSVSSEARDSIQKQFNRVDRPRIRLCLISTRAGGLGTNFVGANRVVIFDQSWNPSHDRQALFRSYRFGQTKPVYVYRLVAHGTIEDRIYARQVTKEALSGRVIDEHQIERHFLNADLSALYQLKIDEYNASKPPLYAVPADNLLANVFVTLKEGIVNCLQHDSLLAHHEDDVLSPAEMKLAWEEFEHKKHNTPAPKAKNRFTQANNSFEDDVINSGADVNAIQQILGGRKPLRRLY